MVFQTEKFYSQNTKLGLFDLQINNFFDAVGKKSLFYSQLFTFYYNETYFIFDPFDIQDQQIERFFPFTLTEI